jgi:hypothetical protein
VGTHLLRALDLGGFVRIVCVDDEGEDESAALVHSWRITRVLVSDAGAYRVLASAGNMVGTAHHTFVWGDGEGEVEQVSGIWEMGLHGRWEV